MNRSCILLCLLALWGTSNAQDISLDRKLGIEGLLAVGQEMGLYQHDSLHKLVNDVGNKLVSRLVNTPFEFRFYLADSAEPNAFALPGGYVFVTRGILPLIQSEDELAGIMAHEIIHVTERHAVKQMKKGIIPRILKVPGNLINAVTGTQLGSVLNAPIDLSQKAFTAQYSQKHERDADEYGIQLAASAGYDPGALAHALEILAKEVEVLTGETERQNYFSDHPYTPSRVSNIGKLAPRYNAVNPNPVTNSRDEFLEKFDRLVFGQNPQQGIFRDSLFIHPDLGLSWIVPAQWNTLNQPSMVAGFTKKGDGIVSMKLAEGAQDAHTIGEEVKEKLLAENKNPQRTVVEFAGDTLINSLSSYLIKMKSKGGEEQVAIDLIWLSYEGLVFQFAGISTMELRKTMSASLGSFRRATDEEVQSVNVYRVKVTAAVSGETAESLSSRTENRLSIPMTSLINDLQPKEALREGQLIKIIEESPYLQNP